MADNPNSRGIKNDPPLKLKAEWPNNPQKVKVILPSLKVKVFLQNAVK